MNINFIIFMLFLSPVFDGNQWNPVSEDNWVSVKRDAKPVNPDSIKIVYFWATWCAPCRVSIQHQNDLYRELDSRQYEFFAVTDEPAKVVRNFLHEVKVIEGNVVTDPDGAMQARLDIQRIPIVYVFDAGGDVLFSGPPDSLSVESLKLWAQGKKPVQQPVEPITEDKREPLFQFSLWESGSLNSSLSGGEGYLSAVGVPLSSLIALLEHVDQNRIVFQNLDPSRRYDLQFRGTDASSRDILRSNLFEILEIKRRRERRSQEVYLLRLNLQGRDLQESSSEISSYLRSKEGEISGVGITADAFAGVLEKWLDLPLLNETGLNEKLDIQLYWDPLDSGDGLRKALLVAGYRLVKAKREIEVLVLEGTSE